MIFVDATNVSLLHTTSSHNVLCTDDHFGLVQKLHTDIFIPIIRTKIVVVKRHISSSHNILNASVARALPRTPLGKLTQNFSTFILQCCRWQQANFNNVIDNCSFKITIKIQSLRFLLVPL